MGEILRVVSILFLEFILIITTLRNSFCHGNSDVICFESERNALLMFKKDLEDPSNMLSSWSSDQEDCCKWAGVVCDNVTGHVQELHLMTPFDGDMFTEAKFKAFQRSKLSGKINPSLLDLKYLTYLNLTNTNFEGIQIPKFIGSMTNLRYLDLYNAKFMGMIPRELGNLSSLRYLRMSSEKNYYDEPTTLFANDLQWLSGLSHLVHLGLDRTNLSQASDWLQSINMLPSLSELHLSNCQLHNLPSLKILNLGHINFTSLKILNLGSNSLQGLIPSTIGNLSSLTRLDFGGNRLQGTIPKSMGNLCNLKELDLGSNNLDGEVSQVLETLSGCISHSLESLSLFRNNLSGELTVQLGLFQKLVHLSLTSNSISGPIPESLGSMSSLRLFSISNNKLNGTLPESLGQLTNLELFGASNNLLEGVVSETHFTNLINLKLFYASGNRLVLKVDPDWIPPFQLTYLFLSSWHLGPQFPKWLNYSKKDLESLDLSCTGISDSIPTWFWNISSHIYYLNLSHNQIYGEIPYIGHTFKYVYLGSNKFRGPLPLLSSNVTELDLSNNSFSGNTSHFFCNPTIMEQLKILHLGGNLLSGEIPNCLMNWPSLEVLKLENNNFTGIIPRSIGYINGLKSLHLRNNNLSGNLPLSLRNCTMLVTLDLGHNEFVGSIPAWIGSTLSNMRFLHLRSNNFNGEIPSELCHLSSLQILDLANNNLLGTIPRCVNKLEAMVTKMRSPDIFDFSQLVGGVIENAFVMAKGREVEYDTILSLVASFDLSSNNLSGDVPDELTLLLGLQTLNLSNNHLTGKIPMGIGDMVSLESLDFSRNQLSGDIPPSLSRLTFMSHLNLSHNNLTGRIPSSTQLQSLNDSNFVGNHLCGPPLTVNCSADREAEAAPTDQNEGDKVEWFYLSMGLGFVVGFWGVCGPILFKRSWRYAYFVFLDLMWYKLCDFCRKHRQI